MSTTSLLFLLSSHTLWPWGSRVVYGLSFPCFSNASPFLLWLTWTRPWWRPLVDEGEGVLQEGLKSHLDFVCWNWHCYVCIKMGSTIYNSYWITNLKWPLISLLESEESGYSVIGWLNISWLNWNVLKWKNSIHMRITQSLTQSVARLLRRWIWYPPDFYRQLL